MQSLRLDNGDQMPILGLGTWKSEPNEVYEAVKAAVLLGYRHIDCAAAYGNEAEIGQALSECIQDGVVKRDELWITSKLWNDSHAAGDVQPALEKTLGDLRLDALDLYLMHWPIAFRRGVAFPRSAGDLIGPDELPISETWEGLEAAKDRGLCHHIGVSNFSVAKLESLLRTGRVKPAVNQIELHPYLQQPSMLDFCRDAGILVTAYSPLGSLDRPDMLKAEGEPNLLEDPIVLEIAETNGATPAQVLISWSIHRGVSVIPKSVDPARLKENLVAAEVPLSEEDLRRIAELDRGRRYLGGEFFAMEGSPYTVASLWDE